LIRRRPFRAVASRVPCRRNSANCIIHSTHRSYLAFVFFLVLHFSLHCIYRIGTRLWGGNRGRSNIFLAWARWRQSSVQPSDMDSKIGLGLTAEAPKPWMRNWLTGTLGTWVTAAAGYGESGSWVIGQDVRREAGLLVGNSTASPVPPDVFQF
jgi:hypothetical protein